MRRIAHSTAVLNKFTDGDPVVPTPATVVPSDWLNIVQEEVVNVILGAGHVLDQADAYPTNDQTQLFTAIQALIGSMNAQTLFTLTNNSGPTNVTGLVFNPATVRSFILEYDIYRKTDTASTECREVGTLKGIYSQEAGNWGTLGDGLYQVVDQRKNDPGVTFSMSGNQLQAACSNIAGVNGVHKLNYRLRVFNA